MCYIKGKITKDFGKVAFYWMEKAAQSGIADAQYYVGKSYLLGSEVEQSYEEADYWLHKAADQGHEKARNILENK